VAWYSFQKDQEPPASLPGVFPLAPLLGNFSDTAYALSGMDLVLAADTALAHLAGAMGIPTLLLLPYAPDFRWLLDRDDSPWYPSMRLFRQPRPEDWGAVIQMVLRKLGGS
jgi:ADP-heptose:LPS heptosyltransferase